MSEVGEYEMQSMTGGEILGPRQKREKFLAQNNIN
jgi:hypothetical protein